MHKHVKICWGAETVRLATEARNLQDTCQVLAKSKDGSVAAAFQVKGKGKVTYSHRQHTKSKTKFVFLILAHNVVTEVEG